MENTKYHGKLAFYMPWLLVVGISLVWTWGGQFAKLREESDVLGQKPTYGDQGNHAGLFRDHLLKESTTFPAAPKLSIGALIVLATLLSRWKF
jgi:hypothetical protein